MYKINTFMLLTSLVSMSWEAKLPSNFQLCKRSDPDLNHCLKLAIEDALPKLKNGIPELNLPPLEPFYIPSLTIGGNTGQAVNLVQNYKNYKMYGLINHKIQRIKSSVSSTELRIDTELFVAESRTEADYNFNGRVLMLPLVGNGKCNVTLLDENTKINMSAATFTKKGKTYLKVEEFTVEFNPGRVAFNFDNLFNGKERLGNEMNKVLNDNWKVIFDDGKNGYEQMMGTVLKNYVNQIFTQIPYDELLLE